MSKLIQDTIKKMKVNQITDLTPEHSATKEPVIDGAKIKKIVGMLREVEVHNGYANIAAQNGVRMEVVVEIDKERKARIKAKK